MTEETREIQEAARDFSRLHGNSATGSMPYAVYALAVAIGNGLSKVADAIFAAKK